MNDLVIIGAGPGGYELALAASKKGLSCVLIEEDNVGGTCLNAGCIPTKAYYQNASFLKQLKKSEDLGVEIKDYDFKFAKAKQRKDEIVEDLMKGILFSLKKAGVDLVKGRASFVNRNTVIVGDTKYQGKNIVIATGSLPITLQGFDGALTSTDILNLDTLPQRLVIIGGGVVGIEMATIFHYMGVEVEVVEVGSEIVANADNEVSKRLFRYIKTEGIKIHLNSEALSYNNNTLEVETKGKKFEISCDHVLISVGRKPNLTGIGLDEIGVEYNNKGITVNENFQTNIENIFAIGDVNGREMLAHYATYSGYQVLKHILKEPSEINFYLVPNCVFTFPEVAWIGITEEVAREMDLDYHSYKGLYRANGKAIAMNQTEGFIKAIVVDGIIKGLHIIGADASVLIHEMVVVMNKNISVKEFVDIIHAHPTLSELFTLTLHEAV